MREIIADYKSADISERRQAMLNYAVKLTEKPQSMSEDDIEPLQKVGLSDRDIHDLNQVVSYFNYVNRGADGLGVKLETGKKDYLDS